MRNRLVFLFSAAVFFFLLKFSFAFFMSYNSDLKAKETHDVLDYKNPKHLMIRQALDDLITKNNFKYKDYKINIVPLSEEYYNLAQVQLGRKITIIEEFAKAFQTKQGIAFVLGHEIAHYESGDLYDIFSILYGSKKVGTEKKNTFHNYKYSQSKEFKADALSVDYLAKAYENLRPKEMLEMFDIIDKLEKVLLETGDKKIIESLKYDPKDSSHPENDSRREAIKFKVKSIT